ncbi:hypothetical protein RIR_jg35673.t1 [Rhizophagus irregularis DAOM 181602=DAOM 197198]|nr:hypothetical protein RIR_jg35673.t1 [Rhizophagus irregularis DAOM 181602=DAOM 197198]
MIYKADSAKQINYKLATDCKVTGPPIPTSRISVTVVLGKKYRYIELSDYQISGQSDLDIDASNWKKYQYIEYITILVYYLSIESDFYRYYLYNLCRSQTTILLEIVRYIHEMHCVSSLTRIPLDFSLLQIILCGGSSRRIQYRQNSQKTASQQESEDFEENYRIKKNFRSSI